MLRPYELAAVERYVEIVKDGLKERTGWGRNQLLALLAEAKDKWVKEQVSGDT